MLYVYVCHDWFWNLALDKGWSGIIFGVSRGVSREIKGSIGPASGDDLYS